MTKTIYFYSWAKEFFEFSNFSKHPVLIGGLEYATNEHYFQSVKFLPEQPARDEKGNFLKDADGNVIDWREYVRISPTPKEAKIRGASRGYAIYPDWDKRRIEAMKIALRAKFMHHENLKRLLLSTDDAILVEDSPTDTFWGCGKNRTGRNMLGNLLMALREELRKETE